MNLIIKRKIMSSVINSKEAHEISLINSEKKADQLFEDIMENIKKSSENGLFKIHIQDITYFTDRIRKKLEDLGYEVTIFDHLSALKISWR